MTPPPPPPPPHTHTHTHTDSADKKTRDCHSDSFFVKNNSATFVYHATLATWLIWKPPIKNIDYLNQSSLSAIPVS